MKELQVEQLRVIPELAFQRNEDLINHLRNDYFNIIMQKNSIVFTPNDVLSYQHKIAMYDGQLNYIIQLLERLDNV